MQVVPLGDNANRAIQGNLSMQVTQPGKQICNKCKWCHLMVKLVTIASFAIWWPNPELMQVVPSGGQIQLLEYPIPLLLVLCTSQKPSPGDISGTKSGRIYPLVSKRPENVKNLRGVGHTA